MRGFVKNNRKILACLQFVSSSFVRGCSNIKTVDIIIISAYHRLCFFRFSEVRFVDGDKLLASGLPVTPEEFESLVKQQCAKTREFLKRT